MKSLEFPLCWTLAALTCAAGLSPLTVGAAEREMTEQQEFLDIKKAFLDGLATAASIRKTEKSDVEDVTQGFAGFLKSTDTETYAQFFSELGVSPLTVDINFRHYVYFELNHDKLQEFGYKFIANDRLVVTFTTKSRDETNILTKKIKLVNGNTL